jgi:hypothetical protein
LGKISLAHAKCRQVNFAGARLHEARLMYASGRAINFSGAELNGAYLSHVPGSGPHAVGVFAAYDKTERLLTPGAHSFRLEEAACPTELFSDPETSQVYASDEYDAFYIDAGFLYKESYSRTDGKASVKFRRSCNSPFPTWKIGKVNHVYDIYACHRRTRQPAEVIYPWPGRRKLL